MFRRSGGFGGLLIAFASLNPGRAWRLVVLEAAFQVFAVAEVYLTLALLTPQHAAWSSALVLETVSRAVTIMFKMLPMRLGVDEVGAAVFATRLGLGSATGITLALVRRMRLLFWSAVGILFVLMRSAERRNATSGPALRQRPVPWLLSRGMTILKRSSSTALLLAFLHAQAAAAQSPAGIVSGTVSLPAPDGQPAVVPGVTLTLTCAGMEPRSDISNDVGQFRFAHVPAGDCAVVAELQDSGPFRRPLP